MWTKQVIKAIKEVAKRFQEEQLIFLTESDLKANLSSEIERELCNSNITVNTESPWYDIYETNSTYYIDITIFDRSKLQIKYDETTYRKGYKYEDEALAIELKYFRHNDDIPKIINDFNKARLLIKAPKNNCFIIACARTEELSKAAELFMQSQMDKFREEYYARVKIFLINPKEIIEIK